MADPFYDTGYPALHDAANSASMVGQKHYLRALRIKLFGLLAAAIGGALFLGAPYGKLGALIVLFGFIAALGAELYSSMARPDRRWYEGRAAAESVKTLAWRYAVGGESFPSTAPTAETEKKFIERVKEVLYDLNDLELGDAISEEQLTPQLRDARALDFSSRKELYGDGRLDEQRRWYANKARWNRTRATRWLIAAVAGQCLGAFGGALMLAGIVTVDAIGILAAGVATIAGWTQAKQYSTLATAYSVTANELAAVLSEHRSVTEESWEKFVGQAEEAISREHTLWRASRGIRIRKQN